MDFDKVKPYSINLIKDEKVWEVKVPTDPKLKGIAYYHIRINKNTGEILNE